MVFKKKLISFKKKFIIKVLKSDSSLELKFGMKGVG